MQIPTAFGIIAKDNKPFRVTPAVLCAKLGMSPEEAKKRERKKVRTLHHLARLLNLAVLTDVGSIGRSAKCRGALVERSHPLGC